MAPKPNKGFENKPQQNRWLHLTGNKQPAP